MGFKGIIWYLVIYQRNQKVYTSGKHIANRISTASLSFMTELTSCPM